MTESEVLAKLEDYKAAINSLVESNNKLLDKIKEKEEIILSLDDARNDYENKIAELQNKIDNDGKEFIKVTAQHSDTYGILANEYLLFREKTLGTVKHLGDVIDSKNEKINELKKALEAATPRMPGNINSFINYRFAKTSPSIAESFRQFIYKCCPSVPGTFSLTPETAALQLSITSKAKETFLSYLLKTQIDKKPIAYRNNDSYVTNFSADEIAEYMLAIED